MIAHTYPKSSFIHSLAYDIETQSLHVGIANNSYEYPNIDKAMFYELVQASSKGRYYNQHIKGL